MAVVAAIVADYFIARKMAASEGRKRKGLLAVSLVLNVGLQRKKKEKKESIFSDL